jgi:uncharacterized protein (TIGR02452 family)
MTTPEKLTLPTLTLDTLIMSRHASAIMCHETEGISARGWYTNAHGGHVDIRAARDAATQGRVAYRPGVTPMMGAPRHAQVPTFVYNQTTLAVAEARVAQGYRVAILNLASAVSPGGGWLNGSQAQEESLARASALVYTLRDDEFYFDTTHRRNPFYNDTVLISPAVPFFRHHNGQFIDTPWQADVITSAAVHANAVRTYMPERAGEIALHMEYRTQKVFQVATTLDADILILGAWGCGAFGNNPEVIAQIMADMMFVVDMRRFAAIDFAVADMYDPPLNYRAFARRFDGQVFGG